MDGQRVDGQRVDGQRVVGDGQRVVGDGWPFLHWPVSLLRPFLSALVADVLWHL